MDQYHSEMAARVWQRVQGGSTAENPTADIPALLQEELTDTRAYRQLASTLGSTHKPVLQQLQKDTTQCVSTLHGIDFLLTGTARDVKPFPLPKELPTSALRRCYAATLRRISQYEQWHNHSEYGPGFANLAELCRKRCGLLLQLLGMLSPN